MDVKEIIRHTADLRVNIFTWSHLIKTEIDTIDSELKRVEEKLENIQNRDGIPYERVNLEAEKLTLISDRKTIVNTMNSVFLDIKTLKEQVPDDDMARLHEIMKNFMQTQSNRN